MAVKARPRSKSESPPTYFFYFSFSEKDRSPYLDRFFDDLSHEIGNLTGTRGPIGFRHKERLLPGRTWPQELEEAIYQSRAFIPVLTPAYVESEYCFRELSKFELRLRASSLPESAISRLIVPVLWIPIRSHQDPASLAARFEISYPPEGLQYLLRPVRRKMYRDFLHRFATDLVTRIEEWPLPPIQTPLEPHQPDIRNVKSIRPSQPLPSPEPLDLLGLAFRLVLAGHAEPDLLQKPDLERIQVALERMSLGMTRSALHQAQATLQSELGDATPNPLWLAWMRATQGEFLETWEEQIPS